MEISEENCTYSKIASHPNDASLPPYLADLQCKNSSLPLRTDYARSKVDWMLSQLASSELQIATETSYQYSKSASNKKSNYYAAQMALRYLKSKQGDSGVALQKMRSTIYFRRKIDVNGLRRAFDDPASPYRDSLANILASKELYVHGHDKDGRSTFVLIPRLVQGRDVEWTLKESIYTMERAIASSRHTDKEINAVIDFSGFSPCKHAPP